MCGPRSSLSALELYGAVLFRRNTHGEASVVGFVVVGIEGRSSAAGCGSGVLVQLVLVLVLLGSRCVFESQRDTHIDACMPAHTYIKTCDKTVVSLVGWLVDWLVGWLVGWVLHERRSEGRVISRHRRRSHLSVNRLQIIQFVDFGSSFFCMI